VIRASATTPTGRIIFLGLTDVNLHRLSTGGDEGVGRPIDVSLADFLPDDGARETYAGKVRLVVFYATRESILELAKALDQDPKGMLDQLGEG
jgi:hypothetical protein